MGDEEATHERRLNKSKRSLGRSCTWLTFGASLSMSGVPRKSIAELIVRDGRHIQRFLCVELCMRTIVPRKQLLCHYYGQ
jgi:hypothetical protein